MTTAPFTNGADLHTDWLFDYFLDHHHGQYKSGELAVIFHGGEEDFFYEISVEMFSNAFQIKLIAGDYLDKEFIDLILKDLLNDMGSTLFYKVKFFYTNSTVVVSFFYKDDE